MPSDRKRGELPREGDANEGKGEGESEDTSKHIARRGSNRDHLPPGSSNSEIMARRRGGSCESGENKGPVQRGLVKVKGLVEAHGRERSGYHEKTRRTDVFAGRGGRIIRTPESREDVKTRRNRANAGMERKMKGCREVRDGLKRKAFAQRNVLSASRGGARGDHACPWHYAGRSGCGRRHHTCS